MVKSTEMLVADVFVVVVVADLEVGVVVVVVV